MQSADGHASKPGWSLDDAVWVVADNVVPAGDKVTRHRGNPRGFRWISDRGGQPLPGAINDLQTGPVTTRAAMAVGILAGVEHARLAARPRPTLLVSGWVPGGTVVLANR